VHHGAHSTPYYQNSLTDPHWQQKAAGAFSTSTSVAKKVTLLVVAVAGDGKAHTPLFDFAAEAWFGRPGEQPTADIESQGPGRVGD
jgi:hypothetical protein